MLLVVLMIAFSSMSYAMTMKHGIYLSHNLGMSADIEGKHQDFANYNGTNPQDIGAKEAKIHNGRMSSIRSIGYNFRATPVVGFGYEAGLYLMQIRMPRQNAALVDGDGNAFVVPTTDGNRDLIVDSPQSKISLTSICLGGLYNFPVVEKITPYLEAG